MRSFVSYKRRGAIVTEISNTIANHDDEKTAHFVQARGTVYCLGIPPGWRRELEPLLAPAYRIVRATSIESILTDSRQDPRRVVLLRWEPANARRVMYLVERLRRERLVLCLWTESTSDLPLHLLADASVEHIARRSDGAAYASAVLCQSLLHCELRHQAEQRCAELARSSSLDTLTGLFNQGRILLELETGFRRARRSDTPLACLMLDIDHFKVINDTYGHRVGDTVLRETAAIIRREIRGTDVAGRYGGDEYLLVLPDTDRLGAMNLGEKLRQAIEAATFRAQDVETLVTVSIGVAATDEEPVATAEWLLRRCDRALYVAKESGRNRIARSGELESLSDFDLFRRKRRLSDHAAPVLALCSSDMDLVRLLTSIAEQDAYLLLSFSDAKEFFGAVEALDPDVALVDTCLYKAGAELLRQLSARLHLRRVWVSVIADANDHTAATHIGKTVDSLIVRDAPVATIREALRMTLNLATLERELVRLRQELTTATHRQARTERLAALGQTIKEALVRLGATADEKTQLASAPSNRESARELLGRLWTFAGNSPPAKREIVALEGLMRSTIKEFSEGAPDGLGRTAGVAITIDVPSHLSLTTEIDSLQLVLRELIANALEAMPSGGKLTATAARQEDGIAIAIHDTGCGMTPEQLARACEPFYTTKERGRGLGLVYVVAVVRELGGTFRMESAPGRGTKALVWLPDDENEELTLRWRLKR